MWGTVSKISKRFLVLHVYLFFHTIYKGLSIYFDIYIPAVEAVQVKVGDLRTQAGLHLHIHLIARLHQLHSQIHVVSWQAVMCSQSQRAREKTHQMILGKKNKGGFHQVTDAAISICNVNVPPEKQSNSTELIKNSNLWIKHTHAPKPAGLQINSKCGMLSKQKPGRARFPLISHHFGVETSMRQLSYKGVLTGCLFKQIFLHPVNSLKVVLQ